jgi:hypothetical protein
MMSTDESRLTINNQKFNINWVQQLVVGPYER